MFFEDINFLNFPAVRFKRSSMKNLESFYSIIYKKFKTEEEVDRYIIYPEHWKRVEREVTYGDWTDSK